MEIDVVTAVKEAIRESEMSQAEVARRMGHTPSWLSQKMGGRVRWHPEDLVAISRITGRVFPDSLYLEASYSEPSSSGGGRPSPTRQPMVPVVAVQPGQTLRSGTIVATASLPSEEFFSEADNLVLYVLPTDDLEPDFSEGDSLMFHLNQPVTQGNWVFASIDGQPTVGQLRKDGQRWRIRTRSMDVLVERRDIEGVAIWHGRRLR